MIKFVQAMKIVKIKINYSFNKYKIYKNKIVKKMIKILNLIDKTNFYKIKSKA